MTRRTKRIGRTAALAVALWALGAGAATAAISWNVAERPDEKIVSLHKQLAKKLGDYPHLEQEPLCVLLADDTYVVGKRTYRKILNRIYRIGDASAIEDGSRRFSVSRKADLERTGAWRLRDGRIERLDETVWEVVEGDDLKEIYFAPTDLQDGDVIGFSTELKHGGNWRGSYLWLADTIPTLMSRTRVQTDEDLAYRISGYHFKKGAWSQKVLSESHGVPNDVRMTLVDIPALPDGPWTPTEWEFLPYLYVNRRGFWVDEIGSWIYNVSWNEVAHTELSICEALIEDSGRITSFVAGLVADETTPAGKVDALHRFVRDEVVSVSYREVDFEERDIVTAMKDRQATRYEKGQMLFTMCKAAGIDVELLVGRSRFVGPIDRGDPTAMQLVDYVVKLDGPEPRYYAPGFSDAPAGKVPPRMQGVEVMAVPASLATSPNAILEELFKKSGGSTAVVWNEYRRRINEAEWFQWVTLPGDTREVAGTCVETVRVDPAGGEAQVTLEVLDSSRLQRSLRADLAAEERLEDYMGARFQDAEIAGATIEHGVALDDTLRATATLSGLILPPAGADEWILPANLVYGRPVLSEWNAHDGDPFIVRATERQVAVWRVPLPAGWEAIQMTKGFSASNPRVSYQSNVFQEDGDLVVMRTLQLNQGITMYQSLPRFRETLAQIQAHERNPVLVRRR